MGEHVGQPALLVFDTEGTVFARLRDLGLDASLWRITDARAISALGGMDLAVYAVGERVDWDTAQALGARCSTVLLAQPASRRDAEEALRSGLAGYINAALPQDALRRALSGVLKGELAYARDVVGAWLKTVRSPRRSERIGALTPRQRQIIGLIAQGASDKEIGSALGIATATAQKHVTNILERLQVPNRAAAVAAVAAVF